MNSTYPGFPFTLDQPNSKIEGPGRYTFPSGNVYVGNFKDGRFDGEGKIFLADGRGTYEATWDKGNVVKVDPLLAFTLNFQGKYTFQDGLEYLPTNWDYCTGEDRRFYTERVSGIKPTGVSQITNSLPPPTIPSNCYDVGDGYYDKLTRRIYTYQGTLLRIPDEQEISWILSSCRSNKQIQ